MMTVPITSAAHADGHQERPGSRAIAGAIERAGIRFVVYLPDSTLWQVPKLLAAVPDMELVPCAREDEGIAIAAGAFLCGNLGVALMEGSGIGLAGLILARMQLQRTPVLLIASHNRALGEAHDYHGATCLAGQGVLEGLRIPSVVVTTSGVLGTMVEQAAVTAAGQRTVVGVHVPDFVMDFE